MALLDLKEKFLNFVKKNDENALYELLGLNPNPQIPEEEIEDLGAQAYADGSTGPQALYTSFSDYYTIFQDFQQRELTSFCDIGGGIGKGKILFDLLEKNSSMKSFSVELVKQRHNEGLKVHQSLELSFHEGFEHRDILNSNLPKAQAYFIYLPVGAVLDHVISQIEKLFSESTGYLYIIESHGDLINYLEESLPLTLDKKLPLHSQRHNSFLHIYSVSHLKTWLRAKKELDNQNKAALKKYSALSFKNYSDTDLLITLKSYRKEADLQLIIEDEDNGKKWIGDCKGWRFGILEKTIEIQAPYRIVSLSQIKGIVRPDGHWAEVINQRSSGLKPPLSMLRKIFIEPECAVEYSNGAIERLELSWPHHEMPCPSSKLEL